MDESPPPASVLRRSLRAVGRLFDDSAEDDADFFFSRIKGLVHIGANRGQERDHYASFGLKVLWIEALPEAYERLRQHVAGRPDQRALQGLIMDEEGKEVVFNVSSNEGMSSSMFEFGRHAELWEEIKMVSSVRLKGTTFPALLAREKIDPSTYDGLVLDTQGSELLVLKGAGDLLDGFRFIKTEAADFDAYVGACTLHDLDVYLAARGFARVLTVPMLGRPGVGTYYDAVYCRRGRLGWRLRFVPSRIRRLLARLYHELESGRRRAPGGEALVIAIRAALAVARRLRRGQIPGLRSRWALGPLRWSRPRLWLRRRARPAALGGGGLWFAPFSEDHTIVYQEVFGENVYDLSLVPFAPDLILDCGAHIGSFTALAAARFAPAPILAFEPDTGSQWFLRRQKVNRPGRVQLIPAAVGVTAGRLSFIEGGHWAHVQQADENNADARTVDVVSLPEVLRERNPRRLLLKMDIEGGELELLPAVVPLLPVETVIFLETHGGTHAWVRCRDLLAAAGFAVCLLRSRDVGETKDAFVDCYAIRKA